MVFDSQTPTIADYIAVHTPLLAAAAAHSVKGCKRQRCKTTQQLVTCQSLLGRVVGSMFSTTPAARHPPAAAKL
jgi:hypothetical protein